MPEFYAEPMKDRKCCSVCNKTVTGKKVLLTCFNCHAITYCGVECQRADWARHEWNCHPVMVTEFPGKGRGLVAARDIEKGEIIFNDKPVIHLEMNAEGHFADPDFMTSLKQQIDSLPAEAKSQYNKMVTCNAKNNGSDEDILNVFLTNSKITRNYYLLHLNIALINHSCAPNALNGAFSKILKQENAEDQSLNLRAIKNICKGEEITICYFSDMWEFGSIPRKRKTALKKVLGFDCKCSYCLSQAQDQEKTLKKLIDLHSKLNPTPSETSDWKREAGLRSRIVDLTMELHIGCPVDKLRALDDMLRFAHLARDKDLVKKVMDLAKQFAEETNLEDIQFGIKAWKRGLAKWCKEFSSNSVPKKEEIEFFLNRKKMIVF